MTTPIHISICFVFIAFGTVSIDMLLFVISELFMNTEDFIHPTCECITTSEGLEDHEIPNLSKAYSSPWLIESFFNMLVLKFHRCYLHTVT